MTDIPTYPFQHNNPAFIANRRQLLGFGLAVESPKGPTPQFVINQAIYDFLDLHRIEGRRVPSWRSYGQLVCPICRN